MDRFVFLGLNAADPCVDSVDWAPAITLFIVLALGTITNSSDAASYLAL